MIHFYSKVLVLSAFLLMMSCAQLHHVQIGEIDQSGKESLEKFDFKASEMGLNLNEAANITKAVSSNRSVHQASDAVATAWKLITYGPRTGEVTFSSKYHEGLLTEVKKVCKGGKITGLTSIRETNKYPVISGEIVRLVGYCKKEN